MPRRSVLALALLLAAQPAWAVREWYDHYLGARDTLIPAGRYAEAITELEAAIRLKPASAVNEQTYGLQFIDYLPYYHLGLCYLRTGDLNGATRYFNIEESRGAIKRTAAYRELLRLQAEVDTQVRQRLAEKARTEVEKALRDAADLQRARKFDEALTRLANAQAAAANLDPATQQRVLDAKERVRAEQQAVAEAEQRDKRREQALAEARRLLDEDRPAEAIVRFDEVLALDPRNAAAVEGKHDAQERILARQSRQRLAERFAEGKRLFDAGQYAQALEPLTEAATDPGNVAAAGLLAQARDLVERVRRQKELAARVDVLTAAADSLLEAKRFSEAWVKLEEVLALDPGNVKALKLLPFAQRMTGETLFEKWLPNQAPLLFFYEPRTHEVEGPSLAVVGFATDDRGIAKVVFRQGGRVVGEQAPQPRPDSPESFRSVRFQREFPLEKGLNEISVTAVDTAGEERTENFPITRRLRFYETAAFFPSALAAAAGLAGTGWAVQRARRRRAVRRRFNPYIAGAPVLDDDMFFGRERLMARIMNVLHHNSLMITGERRIGKTTFMYHLKKALHRDDQTDYQFFPVFTDLQGVPEDGFFHAVMADVVDQLALAPQTLGSLRWREEGAYDGRDFSHDLQRVIEELKARTAKKVKLALMIDEVDVLNEYSERINQRLRSIFMKTFSEHLVAIMSGVGIRRAWKSEGSPWYNFFDEIVVEPLSREDAEALIRTPVEGVFRWEPEAVERILSSSMLRPYLIQKFCIHSVNRMLEQGREVVKTEDVEAVRSAVRFDPEELEPGEAHSAPA
ncbi:MAG TPA: AAA family ATPase [Vicinamibacteria bacterium]|nr:AAA family ATPase [Vicinamibacteria bacterium]